MTEREWVSGTDAIGMLEFIKGKATPRKLRLFAVACCRQLWDKLEDQARTSVEVAEKMADGLCTETELREANTRTATLSRSRMQAAMAGEDLESFNVFYACLMAAWTSDEFALVAAINTINEWKNIDNSGSQAGAALCRDIMGNPFLPTGLGGLSFSSSVVSLAQEIYENRDFNRMPILASSLEEAGCSDSEILNHCTQLGRHARGCWVIDRILGKA